MKTSWIAPIVILLMISFAVYATLERGDWLFGRFVFYLISIIVISGVFLLIGSLCNTSDMKTVVGVVFVVIMAVGLQKVQELKHEDLKRIQAQMKYQQEYDRWYNSLPPYQKLQEDNRRLEEANEQLRIENDAMAR